jgi:antitoxin MazE
MTTKIQKWGNSAGVRIPLALMKAAQLNLNQPVDIIEHNGTIILKPLAAPRYDLSQLLADINEENCHAEIATGDGVGNEAW